MQVELLAIGDRAELLTELWMRTYSSMQSVGLSSEATNARSPGVTLDEANTRLVAALSMLSSLRGAVVEKLELIGHKLPAVKAAFDAMEPQLKAINTALDPWQGASSTDQNGHLQLQLLHPEKGTLAYDLGTPLSGVLLHCNALLETLPFVALALREDGVPVFSGLVRAAGEHLTQAKDAAHQARNELAAAKGVAAKLNKLSANSTELGSNLEVLATAAGVDKLRVDAIAADMEQKLARAREVSKDADTLQQRVTGFTSQFEAFDSQLKSRLEKFSEFESSTKEALRINSERETGIAELTNQADTMIRGATTAGLSKSLDDTREAYEKKLQATQWYFLGSVVFLLICTLPIAAQLIPGPWQQLFAQPASNPVNDYGLLLGAFGKLILVIPGTWATAFFASNYSELFHLSREYAHKAALAKAIDGFKREAPEYAQEIVGSVFMEIQDNPGSRKFPSPATPQNPITRKFLEKVLEAIKVFKGSA